VTQQHTKGPWIQRGRRVYGPPDARSKHRDGLVLVGSVCDERTGIDSPFGCSPEEADRVAIDAEAIANARPFAAAPEMYEALRHSIERTRDLPRYLRENGHKEIGNIVASVLEEARAAIAKANPNTESNQ